MTIEQWLDQEKKDSPELDVFLTKITPFIQITGFNAAAFEKKVSIGVKKSETTIEESLKLESDANS